EGVGSGVVSPRGAIGRVGQAQSDDETGSGLAQHQRILGRAVDTVLPMGGRSDSGSSLRHANVAETTCVYFDRGVNAGDGSWRQPYHFWLRGFFFLSADSGVGSRSSGQCRSKARDPVERILLLSGVRLLSRQRQII